MTVMLGLEDGDEAVYRALLRSPSLAPAALARRLDVEPADLEAALTRLRARGLLRRSRGALRPARPDHVVAPLLNAAETEVDERRRHLGQARRELTGLVEDYLAGRRPGGDLDVEVVEGLPAIRARIDQLVAGTRTELLTLSTAVDADEESIATARAQDEPLIARGVQMRTVVPTAVRDDVLGWAYLEECSARGEQVRMTATGYPRLVVSDAEVAVLPVDATDPTAGVHLVWSGSLVSSLVELFERVWADARPAFGDGRSHTHDPRLLTLLAAGAKDETMARQLGMGLRTVRRDVAQLLADLGATTRFEAGVEAARRGWV